MSQVDITLNWEFIKTELLAHLNDAQRTKSVLDVDSMKISIYSLKWGEVRIDIKKKEEPK